jgi:hypothetical protein
MSQLYPNEAGGVWVEESGHMELDVWWEYLYDEGMVIKVKDTDGRDITSNIYRDSLDKFTEKAWDLYHAGDY